MRMFGSVIIGAIIGAITGIFIPIFKFSTMTFSLENLLVLIGLIVLWHFIYEVLSHKKGELRCARLGLGLTTRF